jgi:hypothetical protein
MPKAISKSTTHTRRAKADDALLDMIRQHRELYDEYDRIEDRDAPRTDELLAAKVSCWNLRSRSPRRTPRAASPASGA